MLEAGELLRLQHGGDLTGGYADPLQGPQGARRLPVGVEEGVTRQLRLPGGGLQGVHGQGERGVPAHQGAHAAAGAGTPQQPRLRGAVGAEHPPPVPGQPFLAQPVHRAGHGQPRGAAHLVPGADAELVQPGVDRHVEQAHREGGHHRGGAQRPAAGQGPLQPVEVAVEHLGVPLVREDHRGMHPDPLGEAVGQHLGTRRGHGDADECVGAVHRPVHRAGRRAHRLRVMGAARGDGHGDLAHRALADLVHRQQEIAGAPQLGHAAARGREGVVEVGAQGRVPGSGVEVPGVLRAQPRRNPLGHQLLQQRSSSLTNHEHDLRTS